APHRHARPDLRQRPSGRRRDRGWRRPGSGESRANALRCGTAFAGARRESRARGRPPRGGAEFGERDRRISRRRVAGGRYHAGALERQFRRTMRQAPRASQFAFARPPRPMKSPCVHLRAMVVILSAAREKPARAFSRFYGAARRIPLVFRESSEGISAGPLAAPPRRCSHSEEARQGALFAPQGGTTRNLLLSAPAKRRSLGRLCDLVMTTIVICLLALAAPAPARATIRYEISLARPAQHQFHVSMIIPGARSSVTVQMPAWNALYQIRDFAYRVTDFHAASASG